MPTVDISRYLHQPRKHYSGARLQQGRSMLDSDFNEGADAIRADLHRDLGDVIGPAGSPDHGFLPDVEVGDVVTAALVRFGAFTQAFVLEYALKPGVMYAGGMRWEQPGPEPVLFQREFLQMGAATAPRAALGEQRQLSYLRGWEQTIAAVEDGEILEPALGGADAAARIRRMRRVEVRTVQAADCAAAFLEVLAELGDGDTASYDAATGELRSNARLQMTFSGSPAGDCAACEPSREGRYLGGASHAIRIMLTGPDRYVWAFDNGAPLYRVRLVLDGGGGARVDMLTPPKDTFHYPRQNAVVEFLPWEALLENGRPQGGKTAGEAVTNEKGAARVGFLGGVDGPYEPSTRSFHVRLEPGSSLRIGVGAGKTDAKAQSQAVENLKSGHVPTHDAIALRWDDRHPFIHELNPSEDSPEGFVTHLYMRVWHVRAPDEPLTIAAASSEPLGQTGLVPVFTGRGRAGDSWTVAVRPDAPDEIVPRELMLDGGTPPHGPREVVAPISLVTWRSSDGLGHQVVAIEDCRPALRSLTRRECCTYTVGPGGDVDTIQAAVDALPPQGGRICVHAGTYREEVRIAGRSNVVLAGCGARTRIESPGETTRDALVAVDLGEHERNISIRSVTLEARGQVGIRATGGAGVDLDDVVVTAGAAEGAPPAGAVQVVGVGNVRITRSRIEMAGAFSDHAAIYLDCPDGALVEDNTIRTHMAPDSELSHAWGGIQIAGGSRDVEIRGNAIDGGRGHGITLGSVVFRALDGASLGVEGAGRGQSSPERPLAITGRIQPIVTAGDPDEDGASEFFPEPQPAIDGLVIADNSITGTGGSGVSSLALQVDHDIRAIGPPLCVRRRTFPVMNLAIDGNRILACARQSAEHGGERFAVGGIVLSKASRATIRHNVIEANGSGLPAPVCGICLARGEDLAIVSNRIRDNGARPADVREDGGFGPRYRGGIVIAAPDEADASRGPEGDESPRNVHLRRNVVDQPDAWAAFVLSRGVCRITGNHFHAFHAGRREERSATPAVFVFSRGKAWEAVDLPQGEPNPDRWRQPAGSREYLSGRAQELAEGDGGALCFQENHVTTEGTPAVQTGALGAWLISTDHLSVVGNQFAARGPRTLSVPHVLAIGLTADASGNRVAETVDAAQISLAAMAPMLTLCAENHLTHCPAVFGCENDRNPDYFLEEDNLVWLQPQEGRCAAPAQPVLVMLRILCGSLFGPSEGRISDFTAIRRNVQP